ncbi:hypothetical protein D3C76_1293440 [compost metagenome]
MRMTFLHQTTNTLQRFIHAAVVGHERHIRYDECTSCTPHNGAGMIYHIVYCHRQGGIITQYDIAERIPDQNHVNACFFRKQSRGIIVSRNHAERHAILLVFFHFHNIQRLFVSHFLYGSFLLFI